MPNGIKSTPSGVDFDFDLERFDPDDCSRINLQ
jgi:hypothetical protein